MVEVKSPTEQPEDMQTISRAAREPALSSSHERGRAEAAFEKVQKAREGKKPTTGYAAEAQAIQEKTARLRLLRLAKETGALTIANEK